MIQGKKVIFYNTGVTSLLSGKEKHIEKIKWVFKIFQQHPEVVLWWRPHPLELSTVQSMLPDLEQSYRELRKWYEDENIGILDESADLNRAIAISDAYYGDWSSITGLYRAIKKPVLYENDRVTSIQPATFLPGTLCVKDESIWFIQLNSNKLVRVDRATYEAEEIISIPMELPYKHRMYNYHIIDIGNSLLLLLEKSKNIYEYEVNTGNFIVHPLKLENTEFHSEIVIERNGKLFMFPYVGGDVLEYDYRTDTEIIRSHMGFWNIKAAKCYEIVGNRIYMVGKGSNRIYQYDFINHSYVVRAIGDEENQYWGVKKVGKYFVLPHLEKKAVTLWEEENELVTELTDFPDFYSYYDKNAYLDMFENDGDLYIFPLYANMILKINVENKIITQAFKDVFFEPDYDINSDHFTSETYLCVNKYENYIYAYALYKKCWQIFNLNNMSVENSAFFDIKRKDHKDLVEQIIYDKNIKESFCEGESSIICQLENYINNLQNSDIENETENNSSIGANIYKLCIRE